MGHARIHSCRRRAVAGIGFSFDPQHCRKAFPVPTLSVSYRLQQDPRLSLLCLGFVPAEDRKVWDVARRLAKLSK